MSVKPVGTVDAVEVEAKFLVADAAEADALLRALAGICDLTADRVEKVTDQYLDTPCLDLHDAGYGCRIRCKQDDGKQDDGKQDADGKEGAGLKRWRLECKAIGSPDASVKVRREVEQPLPGPVTLDALPAEGPVAELLGSLLQSRPQPLLRLLRLVNERRRYAARKGDAAFDVSLDRVEVVTESGGGAIQFQELEIELVEGQHEDLEALVQSLGRVANLRPSRLGKLDRGLWLAGNPLPGSAAPRADQPAWLLLQAQLRHDLRVIEQSRGIALECRDPEGVHRLRTHVRRVRATLAAAGEWLGPEAEKFSRRFKSLADAVGALRDLDVFAASTTALTGSLPDVRERTAQQVIALLDAEHQRLREATFAALSDEDVPGLFLAFRQCILRPAELPTTTVATLAARELARRARSVRKGMEGLTTRASDAAMHDLRIRIKKLRYVLELFAPVLGRRIEDLGNVLRAMQDVLGEHQDACVAVVRIQQLAGSLPMLPQNRDVLLTLGRIQREQEINALQIRKRFLARKGRREVALQLKKALRKF